VTTAEIRIVTMRKFVTIVALSLSLASGAALAQQGATGETGETEASLRAMTKRQ
jgi:hypothetical protein